VGHRNLRTSGGKNFVSMPGIELPPVAEVFGISTLSSVELQHIVVGVADTG
jgi:hypothetical protein